MKVDSEYIQKTMDMLRYLCMSSTLKESAVDILPNGEVKFTAIFENT